jgi:DMSO/TMAO reductase YedYZ molybdopterin-dependent catalytic subunit
MRLPAPPERLRVGPLREGAFPSRLHDERVAALLGVWLAVAFGICMLTGLVSHVAQTTELLPPRPVHLYRVNQGLHVLAGVAAVPLLLAKLWTVYPHLFAWPPARDVGHALERAALLLLVGGSLLQLATGVMNVASWYAFGFFFPAVHYWLSFVVAGALLVHIGLKLPATQRALRRPAAVAADGEGLDRRGFLRASAAASAVVVTATAGATVPGLAGLAVLSPRDPRVGPQGLPVNRTARDAGTLGVDASYRLVVEGPERVVLTLADLQALPQTTARLPIACVEGWSAVGSWTGVRLRDLLALSGAPARSRVLVDSLEAGGRYRASVVGAAHAADPLTLVALRLGGAVLHPDHGYPARLIAPNRPGVLQTKWVRRLVVL